MNYTVNEVLQFVTENDVKFIRLVFCDILGVQKNISIMSDQLSRAFETGIAFDSSAVQGFMNVQKFNLLLFPDPATLTIFPWRCVNGPVVCLFCNIKYADGTPFESDGRYILASSVSEAEKLGYQCKIGTECEFYLFKLDEFGDPTDIPHDKAGYCDILPLDKGENIRREICLTLEHMGINPESSYHEQGPGQNKIDFKYIDSLKAADNFMIFQTVVRTIAARNGLYASFFPKPYPSQNGNGFHINLSLFKNNLNIFRTDYLGCSKEADSFIQGIINHFAEITVFLNPFKDSYERFVKYEKPYYITWSNQNSSSLIYISANEEEYSCMKLCSPDPACNPYLAFSLLLLGGLSGIKTHVELIPPIDLNLFHEKQECLKNIHCLPSSLAEAVSLAEKSKFINASLPPSMVSKYLAAKRLEFASTDI